MADRPPSLLDARPSTRVHSWIHTFALIAVGTLFGVIVTAAAGWVAAAALIADFTKPVAIGLDGPQPTVGPILTPEPQATPTTVPDIAPQPTAIAPRRPDAQLRVAEPYVNTFANAALLQGGVAPGIGSVNVDVRPGNILYLTLFPEGSRDFSVNYTGQMSLSNGRIVVTTLSSSILLIPFRGQISSAMENAINGRLTNYQAALGFTIGAISTTDSEVIADLYVR